MRTPLIYLYLFGLTILFLTATACQTTETTEDIDERSTHEEESKNEKLQSVIQIQ